MATIPFPHPITAEEYEQLDEVIGFRDELIEGERVLSPHAIYPHTAVIERLEEILKSQLSSLAAEKLHVARETGWKFHMKSSATDSVLGPDLMVIREEDARRAITNRRWFDGAPLLVIEVVSPSDRKSRRLQKVGLYLEMGVPHVVEVDYTRRAVRVHRPDSEEVALYVSGDHLSVPFQAAVDEIFAVLD